MNRFVMGLIVVAGVLLLALANAFVEEMARLNPVLALVIFLPLLFVAIYQVCREVER